MEKSGREETGRTMLAKIWDQHVIARLSEDTDLLHVDRHLLHDLGGSRGLLDIKGRGLAVHNPELTFATPDHAISTAHGRAGTIKIGQELLAALARRNGGQPDQNVRCRRARSGHRSRHRPGTGSQPAGLPDRVRRQPHLHAWRPRRARLRHRLQRAGACAGDAGADPAPAENDARAVRGQAAARRHRQGHDPRADRACRCGRRHRLCRRICRQRHPRPAGRGTADHLQSVDRARRQDGHGRAGREDVRIFARAALCAGRRDVGDGGQGVARAAERLRTPSSTGKS